MDYIFGYGMFSDADCRRLYKKRQEESKVHCCGGTPDARQAAMMRKLKHLIEVLKRLMGQLSTAKTPAEKNSIQQRIEGVQAEIAMLEREMKT